MSPGFGLVATAILAFSAPVLATSCTATVTVTITSIISTCESSTSIASSNSILSSTTDSSSVISSVILSTESSSSIIASASSTKTRRPHRHHGHGPDSSITPTAKESSSVNPGTSTMPPTPIMTNSDCQADNCLRAFENTAHFPEGSSFCATYTTAVLTATTGFPEQISNCQSEPIIVSSACSCFVSPLPTLSPSHSGGEAITSSASIFSKNATITAPYTNSTVTSTTQSTTELTNGTVVATTTSLSSSMNSTATSGSPPHATLPLDCQLDNCLRSFENKNFLGGPDFCAVYTAGPPTVTSIPDDLRNCEANPVYLSSACSCINTSLPGAIGHSSSATIPTTTSSNFPSTTAATLTSVTESSTIATATPIDLTATMPMPTTDTNPNSTPSSDPFVNCHQDNCFREVIQSQSQFSEFCSSYTTAVVTATASLPAFVAMCSQPSVISSACSCIAPGTTTITPLATTNAAPSNGRNGGGNDGNRTHGGHGRHGEHGGHGGNGGEVLSSTSATSCPAVTVIYETHTEISTILTTVTGIPITSSSTYTTSFSSSSSWSSDSSASILDSSLSSTTVASVSLRRRWGAR